MDFSKLNQNEKMAVYGSAAVIIGGLVGYSYGFTLIAVIAAFAMLAVVFLPQLSPNTSLPGSRGTLMLLLGAIAGALLILALLVYIGIVFTAFDVRDLFFLLAVVGGVVMAWAGWQALQAEGGKFQLGAASRPSSASEPSAPVSESTSAAPPPPAAAAESSVEAEPTETADEDRRPGV